MVGLVVLVLLPVAVRADAIRLSSGQVIEGKILRESDEYILVRTRLGPVRLAKQDILVIERGPGAAKRILRVPPDRVTPLSALLTSFIPFYSGFYGTDEPAAGVPFAAANGYFALILIKLYAGAVAYTDWGSPQVRTDMFNFIALREFVERQTNPTYSFAAENPTINFHFLGSLMAPDVIRFIPVASMKVGGRIYTKDQLAGYRRRTFYRYAGASIVGGVLSLLYARHSRAALSSGPDSEGLRFAGVLIEQVPAQTATANSSVRPAAGPSSIRTRVGLRLVF